MRREFGKFMVELAKRDHLVYLITGDTGHGIFNLYRENFPERFLNLGLCEQSMIGAASGMALEGLKPYVYAITPFLAERPFEALKIDINQQNANVKLVGYADYPGQGPTHAELNWKEIIKQFRNIKGYFPSDSRETRIALVKSYNIHSPAFISLKEDKTLGKW